MMTSPVLLESRFRYVPLLGLIDWIGFFCQVTTVSGIVDTACLSNGDRAGLCAANWLRRKGCFLFSSTGTVYSFILWGRESVCLR